MRIPANFRARPTPPSDLQLRELRGVEEKLGRNHAPVSLDLQKESPATLAHKGCMTRLRFKRAPTRHRYGIQP